MTERTRSRGSLRRAATAAVAALTMLAAAACTSTGTGGAAGGANALEAARQAGTIPVGIANEAPYGYTTPDGTVTGESVEVARAVLRNIGIEEVQATTVEFGSLIPALNAQQFSMVTAGMFITPERCANAAFSEPDYTAPTAFLVPTGNPQNIATFEDIAANNIQLAVLSGAVEQEYAQKSGVPEANIQVFDTQNTLLQAVTAGRVGAAALTNISLNYLVSQNEGAAVEVTRGFFPVIDGEEVVSAGAFVFRTGDQELLTAFNEELKRLQESGEWLAIVEPFGFTEENLPGPDVTTDALCSAG